MLLPLSLTLALLTATTSEVAPDDRINGLIGDASWRLPTSPALAEETTRIQVHLRFVAAHLAAQTPALPLSERQRANRTFALARLLRYADAGCSRAARAIPGPAAAHASSTSVG